MEDVIDNENGTRTLIAGKTLYTLIGLIQARPGIMANDLLAEGNKLGLDIKRSTLDHHIDRLHLRGAVQKRPVEGWTGKGRALGFHWNDRNWSVVDGATIAAERAANAPAKGGERIRAPLTSEGCNAKAAELEALAGKLWSEYNYSEVKPKSVFMAHADKVRTLYERAAGLRVRAASILPVMASMTFAPEPEPTPEAAPAPEVVPAEQVAAGAFTADGVAPEAPSAEAAPAPKRKKK